MTAAPPAGCLNPFGSAIFAPLSFALPKQLLRLMPGIFLLTLECVVSKKFQVAHWRIGKRVGLMRYPCGMASADQIECIGVLSSRVCEWSTHILYLKRWWNARDRLGAQT